MSENFARGEPASLEQIALIRMAMRHIHDVLSEISTFAHKTSRGVSLRPSVLQRCYRDIHSGTQHILLADEIVQECGKVMLGAAGEDAQWTMFGVRTPGERRQGALSDVSFDGMRAANPPRSDLAMPRSLAAWPRSYACRSFPGTKFKLRHHFESRSARYAPARSSARVRISRVRVTPAGQVRS